MGSEMCIRDRYGTGIDRIEIAPGGQHFGPPAGRRAGRAGLDEIAIEGGQRAGYFSVAAGLNRRPDPIGNPVKHGACLRPIIRGVSAAHEIKCEVFEPLDRIAVGPPRIVGVERFRSFSSPRIAKHAVKRIESVEAKIGGQRADQ